MLVIIAGTNRPRSITLSIAGYAREILEEGGEDVAVLDLAMLPRELMAGTSYAVKPPGFQAFQDAVLGARGILTVVPEYNGSFPGILKYFIDMLRFPESLNEKPAGFVGISSGPWGAVRAVEQLEMVFQYRHAHLYGRRVFIPDVRAAVDDAGRPIEPAMARRLGTTLRGFARFCDRLEVGSDDES
jgi:NAD(P)H-dependent FMN reductase